MLLLSGVRNGGRNSHTISNYLVSLSQAKVGNEARMVITFLLVIKVMLAVVGMLADDVTSDSVSLTGGGSARVVGGAIP